MNIGIAGAGLMGRLLAWQLLRRGHRVTLFDRDSTDARLSARASLRRCWRRTAKSYDGERAVFDWGRESLGAMARIVG